MNSEVFKAKKESLYSCSKEFFIGVQGKKLLLREYKLVAKAVAKQSLLV